MAADYDIPAARTPSQRLFFALWPPPGIAAALGAFAAEARAAAGGKPVRAENVHLTLAFLGSVGIERVPAATAAGRATEAVERPAFSLPLEVVRFWPQSRILWTGPPETPAPLEALVTDLSRALADAGFALESRPFAAHVTLLRKAHLPRRRLPPLPRVAWPVEAFALVRSTPGEDGSAYATVARFAFASSTV